MTSREERSDALSALLVRIKREGPTNDNLSSLKKNHERLIQYYFQRTSAPREYKEDIFAETYLEILERVEAEDDESKLTGNIIAAATTAACRKYIRERVFPMSGPTHTTVVKVKRALGKFEDNPKAAAEYAFKTEKITADTFWAIACNFRVHTEHSEFLWDTHAAAGNLPRDYHRQEVVREILDAMGEPYSSIMRRYYGMGQHQETVLAIAADVGESERYVRTRLETARRRFERAFSRKYDVDGATGTWVLRPDFGHKLCNRCHELKPEAEYTTGQGRCRPCKNEVTRLRRQNP